MRRPKLSDRLKKEEIFIRRKFGTKPICNRCEAILDTFADICPADLDDPCPGFLAIDNAKAEFNKSFAVGSETERGK